MSVTALYSMQAPSFDAREKETDRFSNIPGVRASRRGRGRAAGAGPRGARRRPARPSGAPGGTSAARGSPRAPCGDSGFRGVYTVVCGGVRAIRALGGRVGGGAGRAGLRRGRRERGWRRGARQSGAVMVRRHCVSTASVRSRSRARRSAWETREAYAHACGGRWGGGGAGALSSTSPADATMQARQVRLARASLRRRDSRWARADAARFSSARSSLQSRFVQEEARVRHLLRAFFSQTEKQ